MKIYNPAYQELKNTNTQEFELMKDFNLIINFVTSKIKLNNLMNSLK